MRFKTRIKGLRPEVFERAAELLDSGEVKQGCCYALLLTVHADSGAYSAYTGLLNEVFAPAHSRFSNIYWFGPVESRCSSWHGRYWRAAKAHRIYSLLLLAAMIRFANQ